MNSTPLLPAERGEYYLGGDILRGGVYSVPPGKVTLKQAIIAAGGATGPAPFIRVIRREDGKESLVLNNTEYSAITSGEVNDLFVHANDIIMVTNLPQKWQAATSQQTPTP